VCGATTLCSNGSCVLFALGCPSGRTACGQNCVDEHTDFANCGSCGHACAANQVCQAGVCTSACAGSLTACSGNCVNTATDPNDCGTCGHACAASQVCVAGVCGSPGDECLSALGLSMDTSPLVVTGSTSTFTNAANSCGAAADVYYRFTLSHREVVYVDTFGSTFDTLVGIADTCGAAPTCNNDACSTLQSQLVAVLDPGTHFLVVDGASASGSFVLHVQQVAVSGSSPMSMYALPATFTQSGDTSALGVSNTPGTCGAGPDQWFSWASCPTTAAGNVDATVCGAATYDSVLQLLNGAATGGGCNDNACALQSHLVAPVPAGAGLHVLFVDGSTTTSAGTYTVTGTHP
jgi:hypothetical protein